MYEYLGEGGLTAGTQLLPLPSVDLPQPKAGKMGTAKVHWLANPLRMILPSQGPGTMVTATWLPSLVEQFFFHKSELWGMGAVPSSNA